VLAGPVVYSIALGRVNELWDVRTAGLATEAPGSTGERIVIALGVTAWVLNVIGVLILLVVAFST
jgi:hypothetical protein